jgi:RHS repeat-associated protein
VLKTDSGTAANSVQFVYDGVGHLIGEYTTSGTRIQEYVWLDDTLVAVLRNFDGASYQFVETDHLGTPRAVVHPTKNVMIWRWDLTPSAFGENAVNENPDGDGLSFKLNLRYPGQYYDSESGTHFNRYRTYEAATGRYLQSDPIGLSGGASTYGYVGSSPLIGVDPLGLVTWTPDNHASPIQGSPLIPGKHAQSFPGDTTDGGLGPLTGTNAAARTFMDWTVTATCGTCDEEFKVTGYTIEIRYIVRKAAENYNGHEDADEQDHISDLMKWVSGQGAAIAAEQETWAMSEDGIRDKDPDNCVARAQAWMNDVLGRGDSGLANAFNASHQRWDVDHLPGKLPAHTH